MSVAQIVRAARVMPDDLNGLIGEYCCAPPILDEDRAGLLTLHRGGSSICTSRTTASDRRAGNRLNLQMGEAVPPCGPFYR
jgi:hypothetical protein